MEDVYAKTQFAIGFAGVRFNQLTKKWMPAVGGAIKPTSEHEDAKAAQAEAQVDLNTMNTKDYV
jgi:hypothetical protein